MNPDNKLSLVDEAKQIIEANEFLSDQRKADALALLTDERAAKIKLAELLMEGRELVYNAKEYNVWLQNVLAFSKHVYGDAPTKNINLELKADMTSVIREAYQERMREEEKLLDITPQKDL